MANRPGDNRIQMKEKWRLNGRKFEGPPLSEDDAFNSQPMTGKLAYSMPSVMDLFGRPIESFNGQILPNCWEQSLNMQLEVFNTDTQTIATCDRNVNCQIQLRRDVTPLLIDTIPNLVYEGTNV